MNFFLTEIRWCYEIFHKTGHHNGRHNHTFFHYTYVIDGKGEAVVDGKQIEMIPHHFYLFNPYVYHEYKSIENLHLYEIKFDVMDRDLYEDLNSLDTVIKVDAEVVERIFRSAIRELDKNDKFSHANSSALFCELITHLLRRDSSYERRADSVDSAFVPVVKYIKDHYGQKICLEDLCATVHMEKTYFVKLFKRSFGVPPMTYLQDFRIKKAVELIQNSDMNVSQISDYVGFGSIHYFSNTFKKQMGISPNEYRRKHNFT